MKIDILYNTGFTGSQCTTSQITLTIINAIPLALCGMRCLYPINPLGETMPWPGKNPYSKPSIRRGVYIQFNETQR